MNNPQQSYSKGNYYSPRLKTKRKFRVILGVVIIALVILSVVYAAFKILLALLASQNSEWALAVESVSTILFFTSILSLAVFIGATYYCVLTLVRRKIREAQQWPSTKGLVVTSEVRNDNDEEGWYAKIIYRYEVGGRVYENSRIAVAVEHGNQSLQAQEQLASRFPVGAHVPVYYDPRNPADAALTKGDPNSWAPSLFQCW
jgi:hypothetical protein